MKRTMMVFLLLAGSWLAAQANPKQSANHTQCQFMVQGRISRLSGDYVLMQSDQANSYVLYSANNVPLGHYLGQQVKVTGIKSPTLSDTSDTERSGALLGWILGGGNSAGIGSLIGGAGGLGTTGFRGHQKITLSRGQEMLIRITSSRPESSPPAA